jgi:hypothetical protein
MGKSWSELSDTERHEVTARALGWEERDCNGVKLWFDASGQVSLWGGLALGVLPPFATALSACRLVEDEIARRYLVGSYSAALCNILGFDWADGYEWGQAKRLARVWDIAYASPDQRCHAALKALGVAL